MDFIGELVFEIILEGIFGLTVKNPKTKTWVKTAVFLIFSEAVAGVFLWISYVAPAEAGQTGALICRGVAIALAVGFLIAAIHGHKNNWKHAED